MADYTTYAIPHPEWVEYSKAYPSSSTPLSLPNRDELNANRAETFRRILGNVEDVAREDISIITADGGVIPGRIYRRCSDHNFTSSGTQSDRTLSPLYIHLHGGGFHFGNLETEDVSCALVCKHTGAIVLNVNYRHAPVWKFPTPVHDAWDALNWATGLGAPTLRHDRNRVIVGGVSAGGSLACATALRDLQCEGRRIAGVVLVMPSTVHPDVYPAHLLKDSYTSLEQNAQAPILPKVLRDLMQKMYQPDASNQYVSPLMLPDDQFRGYPRTVVHIAGLDPLRDEGLLFEEKLKRSGVETCLRIYDGLPHVFMNIPQLEMSRVWRENLYEDIMWLLEP